MKVKIGVDLGRLRDEIRWGLFVADKTYQAHGCEAFVTSTYEGVHKEGSLHYKNRAVDLRPPGFQENNILWELKIYLGADYDVVVEPGCIHIEWDPK